MLANTAGSGPFTLANYAPGNELRLSRNANSCRVMAAVSTVGVTQVDDAVSQSQALESGAADIAMQIDPDTAAQIASPDVMIDEIPSFNFVHVAFSPGVEGMADRLTPQARGAKRRHRL